MYLLDTNIISMLDPRRQAQAPALVDWIERNGASLFLSVQTITEMDAGVLKLRREKKRARANELGELVAAILAEFKDRVLPIDIDTAHIARLAEKTYRQPIPLADLVVAAWPGLRFRIKAAYRITVQRGAPSDDVRRTSSRALGLSMRM